MDKEDLSKFYRSNVTPIYRFFYSRTYSRELSEDLTAEVFSTFVEAIRNPNSAIEDSTKYLYGIARNVFLTYLKSKYKHTDIDIEVLEFHGILTNEEESPATLTLEERALPYIKQLPKSQRKVLHMRLIEKMSLAEISKVLKKDMNYVKTTQRRAIANMKILIACTPIST